MMRVIFGLGAATAVLLGASAGQAGEAVRLAGGYCPPNSASCPKAPLQAPDRPPHAKPGQCFAKVRIAPRYESYPVTVVVSPARQDRRVIPAVYEAFDQRVLVSPERAERTTIPATYRTVREIVVVRPGGSHVEETPPVYDTVFDKVMVRPARSEWRRSFVGPNNLIPTGARIEPTGEIMCLVETPAVFERVGRRVMVSPGDRVVIEDPPVTRVVERQVVDRPAKVLERVIPAVYRIERASRLVRPERIEVIDIPAVTRTETRQRLVEPGRDDWSLIDCPPDRAPPLRKGPPKEQRGIPPVMDGERG